MKNKNVKNVSKLLVALLVISALPSIVYAADDTESFGISLAIDYTASGEPSTEYNDTESFGISLAINYTASSGMPSIEINTPPTPANESTGVNISTHFNFTISDPNGNNITLALWNYSGDAWVQWNSTSGLSNGTYEFIRSGLAYNTTFTWRASVNNSGFLNNSDTWTFTTAVEGETPNQPPTANFTYSATGLTVSFTDTSNDSDGTIALWSWNFGDDSSSTAQNPSHTFASSGAYNVTLTAKDNDNATDSTYQLISVSSGSGDIIDSDLYQYLWYFIGILVALFALVFIGLLYKRK